jgi:hypothetical protein
MTLSIFERDDICTEATIKGFSLLQAICHALARPDEIEKAAVLLQDLHEARRANEAARVAAEQARSEAAAERAALAEERSHHETHLQVTREWETRARGELHENTELLRGVRQELDRREEAIARREREHEAEVGRMKAFFGSRAA